MVVSGMCHHPHRKALAEQLAELLIAMSLTKLVRDGHVETRLSNRGTLFSYVQ